MRSMNKHRRSRKRIPAGSLEAALPDVKRILRTGSERSGVQSLVFMTLCVTVVFLISLCFRLPVGKTQNQVFASVDSEAYEHESLDHIPSGFSGVIASISETPAAGSTVDRLGTSFGQVMVGQRVSTVDSQAADLDISASMENRVNELSSTASMMAANPKIMSDTDYVTLLHIVEAEAGSEDIKGRILVANVIMNRVRDEEFPDNITDVVWERRSGVPQFSPTSDGSIERVTVSDETKEAVKQMLEGADYSEGALFFIQRDVADKSNISWFEKDLKKLFKYGVHEFYTYPDRLNIQPVDQSEDSATKE